MSDAAANPLPRDVVALVAMRNVVLFPHVLLPISVGREKSVAAVLHCAQTQSPLGVVLQKDAQQDDPSREGLCDIGTLATVVHVQGGEGGLRHAMCQGIQRFRILEMVDGHPFLAARIERLDDPATLSAEAEALGLQLRERAVEVLSLLPGVPAELSHALQSMRAPAQLADITSSLLDAEVAEKQDLLQTLPVEERLRKVLATLSHRVQVLRLSQEIGERTKAQIDDRQREFILREQLKTIQRELGEDGGSNDEIERLEKSIAEAAMPEEIDAQVRKELHRFSRMPDGAGEAAVLRTWLEWMTELPWRAPQPLAIDLAASRAILEADHCGLAKVKRRIIEFLAVRKLNPQGRAPIICFAGPPGVGKTSLGQSIARALQRPFVRVSLGGVHDEAEIRGHRRTYVGAMPGNIVQALRKAGARDCVMMLDEVDKMSGSHHGDPSAALLEVLDPEQNGTFRDNYLGVPFDLSRVVFLCTANVMDNVSLPVRDRMEVIDLPGYALEEKQQIALAHLLPRQLVAHGLSAQQFELEDPALRQIIAEYTREAGVRQLERQIAAVVRHAAVAIAEGGSTSVRIGPADLEAILGVPRHEHEAILGEGLPGVATGLAWTPAGGDILFIEASRMAGSNRLILTGQLGEVMKESAQAALTLLKAHAADLNVGAASFESVDVHVHVPAGAVPKDGPSAGVAMFVALASLFTNRPVLPDVAMTGEISLRGRVLPVGGIKEKVLAAQRAGTRVVLLPERNLADLRDIPADSLAGLRIVALSTIDDALAAALAPVAA
jgi:ATP-dependent Lon protease